VTRSPPATRIKTRFGGRTPESNVSRGEERRKAREGGSDMTKFYIVLGVIAVIGIGAVGYSVGSNSFGTPSTELMDIEGLDDMALLAEVAQGVTLGDPEAPYKVIEFGDYQCPGCGGFALSVKPQIQLALVESGRAQFIFYDFPLTQIHPHAVLAARSARCADDQGKFWEYHETLFRNQSSWASLASAVNTFVGYGEDLGLDPDTFEACVKSDQHTEVVSANHRLGYELGVGGTPTVMVQGYGELRRVATNSYQGIEAAINAIEESVAAGN
jgi:protein-disulfide isomerase